MWIHRRLSKQWHSWWCMFQYRLVVSSYNLISLKSSLNVASWIRRFIDLQLGLMDTVWIACCMDSSVYMNSLFYLISRIVASVHWISICCEVTTLQMFQKYNTLRLSPLSEHWITLQIRIHSIAIYNFCLPTDCP